MNRNLRLVIVALLCLPSSALPAINVLTWHNDPARTGQNLKEIQLTPVNVNSNSFGKLFQINVDGKVDAQPLIVSNVSIPNRGTHNVVIIATEHDSVYCCDADFGTVLWRKSILRSGETPSDSRGCDQVVPEIGITATPAIDLTVGPHGTIYVVAMSKNATSYFQRIHALDLTTGAEQFGGPVAIAATYPGTGDNNNGQGQIVFDPSQYKERSGLVLTGGVVYTFWASHCDKQPYTGWVIGYNKNTLAQARVLNLTPNGNDGAVWGDGAAPAVDGTGQIYALVGNGTFETSLDANGFPSKSDFGNCIVKLSANQPFRVSDYWTMFNTIAESKVDQDLGSGGAVLLPPMIDVNGVTRNLVAGAGKDKHIYIADRNNLGKFVPSSNATLYQDVKGVLAGGVFSLPAYFNGHLYYGAVNDRLKSFAFANARLVTTPASRTTVTFIYPGTTPSVSANGTANAIVWATSNATPAVLYAFDATNLAKQLYSSNDAGTRDNFGTGNKFIVPTVANGKVYVGTTSSVGVFGLLNPPHLSNISARALVAGEQNQLVMEFTIQGRESKTVGLRVLGPSLLLSENSIATRLPDPILELRDDNGRIINSNDNWEANNSQTARTQQKKSAPHTQKEPSIMATLPPGDYTVAVHDANNAAGIALVEVYDLSSPLTTNFANFSVRGFVGTGDDILIGGITVRGTATEQVLFRALGSDLGKSGIANSLANPSLEVRDNNGVLLASNHNWQDSPQAEEISSIGLAPGNENDAALLLTLAPGNYTAVVRDAAGSTGVAQLETKELR
jgi:hypothetical protein